MVRTEQEIRDKIAEIQNEFFEQDFNVQGNTHSLRNLKLKVKTLKWVLGYDWVQDLPLTSHKGARLSKAERLKEIKENNND